MQTSETIGEIAKALAAAQGQIGHAAKDRTNPAFKSSYATLASVLDACREPLAAHGISILQPASTAHDGDRVLAVVETRLLHVSGEWLASTTSMPLLDVKVQTLGSALTYLRRYALSAMVSVAPDDDDGNAASADNAALHDARARIVARLPALGPECDRIIAQALPAPTRLDHLRELYRAHTETTR